MDQLILHSLKQQHKLQVHQLTYTQLDNVLIISSIKKMEDGDPISSTWGNANQWASNAAADGHTVNNTPKEGSILQSSAGAFGHVAYVENVNSDGSIEVS